MFLDFDGCGGMDDTEIHDSAKRVFLLDELLAENIVSEAYPVVLVVCQFTRS